MLGKIIRIKGGNTMECHEKYEEAMIVSDWGIEQGRFYKCVICGKWLTNDEFYIDMAKGKFNGMSKEKINEESKREVKKFNDGI